MTSINKTTLDAYLPTKQVSAVDWQDADKDNAIDRSELTYVSDITKQLPITKDDWVVIEAWQRQQLNIVDNSALRPNMVFVLAGEFLMGSTDLDPDADSYEKPQHKVVLTKNFYLAETETTQGQYAAIMENNPSYFKGDLNKPVERVTWYEAVEYCLRLSLKEAKQLGLTAEQKKILENYLQEPDRKLAMPKYAEYAVITQDYYGYRLPTEAEWEYAAKGGTVSNGYKYSGSNELDTVAVWYTNETKEVKSKLVKASEGKVSGGNELEIYDMSGNVWEWNYDWYSDTFYSNSPKENPIGHDSGSFRVLRGGSWGTDAGNCFRSAFRCGSDPCYRFDYYGFRLARNVQVTRCSVTPLPSDDDKPKEKSNWELMLEIIRE